MDSKSIFGKMASFGAIPLFATMFLLMSGSCANMRNSISNEGCMRIKSAEAVDHNPGVQSNLRSNRELGISVLLECEDSVQLKHILYKDVKLEVNSYRHLEQHFYGADPMPPRAFEIFLYANKFSYDDDARIKTVEEVKYERSGVQMGDSIAVVYEHKGELFQTKPAFLVISDPVNHP